MNIPLLSQFSVKSGFSDETWRTAPQLFPKSFSIADEVIVGQWFRSLCMPPARSRLYAADVEKPSGTAARIVPTPEDSLVLFDHFEKQEERVTLLLNGIESVDPQIAEFQQAIGVNRDWRMGEAVATLSTLASGIGYHAGTEDGFILQLAGRRHWRVWSSAVVSHGYRSFLCGNPTEQGDVPPPTPPLIEYVLEPGDALYIPALFPHWGETLARSVSLSLAWEGISIFTALSAIWPGDQQALLDESTRLDFFRLLPDPPPGSDPKSFLDGEFAQLCDDVSRSHRPAAPAIDRLTTALTRAF